MSDPRNIVSIMVEVEGKEEVGVVGEGRDDRQGRIRDTPAGAASFGGLVDSGHPVGMDLQPPSGGHTFEPQHLVVTALCFIHKLWI
jgi:hypothetical protein